MYVFLFIYSYIQMYIYMSIYIYTCVLFFCATLPHRRWQPGSLQSLRLAFPPSVRGGGPIEDAREDLGAAARWLMLREAAAGGPLAASEPLARCEPLPLAAAGGPRAAAGWPHSVCHGGFCEPLPLAEPPEGLSDNSDLVPYLSQT